MEYRWHDSMRKILAAEAQPLPPAAVDSESDRVALVCAEARREEIETGESRWVTLDHEGTLRVVNVFPRLGDAVQCFDAEGQRQCIHESNEGRRSEQPEIDGLEQLIEVDVVEFEHDGLRYRHVAPEEQVLRLTITQWRRNPDGGAPIMIGWDSRDETWETLVERRDWGAFRDVAGFDLGQRYPPSREIQTAVDAAVAELRAIRDEAAADEALLAS
jgi:hypothetical protein